MDCRLLGTPGSASAAAQSNSGFLQNTVHEPEGTASVVSDPPDTLARGVPLDVLGSKRRHALMSIRDRPAPTTVADVMG